MGAKDQNKCTDTDLIARLKKKLVAERKRRAKFELQLKSGAGNRILQAAMRLNHAATKITKNLKILPTTKRLRNYKQRRMQKRIEAPILRKF